ncbi:MAG TPA: hypothetical protein PKC05_03545 [Candidatus Saccharibacteria bacterium]|nr:hypothetical protein [Candidatus Saccharibacteria bacterium]
MRINNSTANRIFYLGILFASIISLLIILILPQTSSAATNGANFNPGRIIDDSIFNNTRSMTPVEIQNFLNSKVPVCDTWHPAGSGSQGAQPPWICLKDYTEGGRSAAQIIWDASQFYGINPQVIIVTLQKETGLVTDTWPYPWQYRTAMGMGCPDGAPCDAQYYGFTNQVYQGSRHLINFQQQNPNWTVPHRIGINSIKWNPDTACGTSQVNIENGATSALYSYTPYRPNQAALNNLYGTGDGCSSYGNRNFWRDFTDWFGGTTAAALDYQLYSATQSILWTVPGQTVTYNSIVLKNTGYTTWYPDGSVPTGQHPTRLVQAGYRNSPFADITDPAWLGTQNQLKITEPSLPIPPGEYARFTFRLKGPYQYISGYTHKFIPVLDSVAAYPDKGMQFINHNVPPPYAHVSHTSPPLSVLPNQKVDLNVVLKNTGTVPWYADGSFPAGTRPMRLVGVGYQNTQLANIADPAWLGTKNQIKMTPSTVNPGENATFSFSYLGPFSAQSSQFRFYPFLDGVGPLNDLGMAFAANTPAPIYRYQFVSATNPPANMSAGSTADVSLTLKNTSNFIWRNEANRIGPVGALRLGMVSPYYKTSSFYESLDPNWLSSSQIRMNSPIVNPGENATFTFKWKAPNTPGTYTDWFAPVVDGVSWMPDLGMGFRVTVQ